MEGSRGEADDWNWREFDFRGQRADLNARPVVLAPWHWRLDWQLWIAACKGPNGTNDRWFLSLLLKLLENDAATSSLLHANPFLDSEPPTHVRVAVPLRFCGAGQRHGGRAGRASRGACWSGPSARRRAREARGRNGSHMLVHYKCERPALERLRLQGRRIVAATGPDARRGRERLAVGGRTSRFPGLGFG